VSIFVACGQSTYPPFSVLTPVTTVLPASVISGFAAGDFNGDGKADIIGLSYQASTTGQPVNPNVTTLRIFIGNGDGSFQPAQVLATYPGSVSNVSTGDFNGDGKLDMVVVADNKLLFYPGNGDGTFDLPISIDVHGEHPAYAAD
jgi:hypothetical protein